MEPLDAILPYLVRYAYLGLFGLILVFSFVLPFSKTLVIVGAGILAARGIGSLPAYLLASLAGLMTADSIYYLLGYWGGERVLEWRLFSGPDKEKRLRAAEARFRRHEWLAVFTARFMPFLRSLVFVVAGFSRMSPLRFLAADFLSACILVPVAMASGYLFAENREALVQYVKKGEFVLGAVVCLVLAVLFFFPRRPGGDRTAR